MGQRIIIEDETISLYEKSIKDDKTVTTLRKVIKILKKYPGVVLAGGAIRDLLSGIAPRDFDIWIPAHLWNRVIKDNVTESDTDEDFGDDYDDDKKLEHDGIHYVHKFNETAYQTSLRNEVSKNNLVPNMIPYSFDYHGNMFALMYTTYDTSKPMSFVLYYTSEAIEDISRHTLTWSGKWEVNSKAHERRSKFLSRGWKVFPAVLEEVEQEEKEEQEDKCLSAYGKKRKAKAKAKPKPKLLLSGYGHGSVY